MIEPATVRMTGGRAFDQVTGPGLFLCAYKLTDIHHIADLKHSYFHYAN